MRWFLVIKNNQTSRICYLSVIWFQFYVGYRCFSLVLLFLFFIVIVYAITNACMIYSGGGGYLFHLHMCTRLVMLHNKEVAATEDTPVMLVQDKQLRYLNDDESLPT